MRLRAIREQEKKIAKEIGQQTKQLSVEEAIIMEKELMIQEYQKKQLLKQELERKKEELLAKLDEAKVKYTIEQQQEEERNRQSMIRQEQIRNRQAMREKEAMTNFRKKKAEVDLKSKEEAARKEVLREAEQRRAEQIRREFQLSKKPEKIDPVDDKKGLIPFKVVIENFKYTNNRIEEPPETEEEKELRLAKEREAQLQKEEIQRRVDARAKSALRRLQQEKEMEAMTKEVQQEKIEKNLNRLKPSDVKNKNRMVFNDDLLEKLFLEFITDEERVFTSKNFATKYTEKCYWKSYPDKKDFEAKFKSRIEPAQAESQIEQPSFSLTYSQAIDGQEDLDLSSSIANVNRVEQPFNQSNGIDRSLVQPIEASEDAIDYTATLPDQTYDIGEDDLTASLENIDLKRFIDEQEKFLKKLNRENDVIRQEIKEYDSSFEKDKQDELDEEKPSQQNSKSQDSSSRGPNKFISFRNFQEESQEKRGKNDRNDKNSSDAKNSNTVSKSIHSKHSLNSISSESDNEQEEVQIEDDDEEDPVPVSKIPVKHTRSGKDKDIDPKMQKTVKIDRNAKTNQNSKSDGGLKPGKSNNYGGSIGHPLGEIEERIEEEDISEASNYYGNKDRLMKESHSEKVNIRQFISNQVQTGPSPLTSKKEEQVTSKPSQPKSEYIRNFMKDFDISISDDDSSDEEIPKFQSSVVRIGKAVPIGSKAKAAEKPLIKSQPIDSEQDKGLVNKKDEEDELKVQKDKEALKKLRDRRMQYKPNLPPSKKQKA